MKPARKLCLEKLLLGVCSLGLVQLLQHNKTCDPTLDLKIIESFLCLVSTHVRAHQCSNQNHSRSKLAWSLHTPRPAFSLRSGTHVQWNQHVCSMFPGGCQAEPAEARSAVICQAHYSHKCDGCEPCECETVGGIKRERERESKVPRYCCCLATVSESVQCFVLMAPIMHQRALLMGWFYSKSARGEMVA